MAETSSIEWTDATFNPWIGCTKVSKGCDGCYAERSTPARTMSIAWGTGQPRKRTGVSNWRQPITWNSHALSFELEHGRRRRVFCASLADWADNEVPIGWLVDLLDLIRITPHLDWLLLTKRIGNVTKRLGAALNAANSIELREWIALWLAGDPPTNVWLGISVVTQAEADRDLPKLNNTPAMIRWLSMEPLVEAVDIGWERLWGTGGSNGIDWVVVGGESGPGARPMHPDWARSLRDQCKEAGVPFLFKQHGEWMPTVRDGDRVLLTFPVGSPTGPEQPEFHDWPDGAGVARVGKKAAGRLLDGALHDGYPS